ncbi:MAG: D-glycero-beta-D-manno-heptose 1-phosphate adenylyltransferase [Candidatus Caldipriscus sp.]|jgi:D-beta-D-heptose 7-phosphate kinase/D-beta-D-heptose 1-phosphate adenosyltransferase|nr:D-glycero-beta-D-manno-heptose 1-phosphate adenylyltransferase [Candidatus Caldipriscus sp.]
MKGFIRDAKFLGEFLRKAGYKIVFTNGCFDIIHRGHVELLKFARSLGDVLVVGLNDDESVRRLKGKNRPINTLEDRAFVLLSIRWVDFVVPFSEDTPERIIREISPDVLVKGGDYRIENIAGADFVLSKGGRVEIFNYLEGYSTTSIIKKIWEGRSQG